MIGQPVTLQLLNTHGGSLALQIKNGYDAAVDVQTWLTDNPIVNSVDPLVTLGMSAPDAAVYRTAFADLAFQKTSAFDSSVAVKQLMGIGI